MATAIKDFNLSGQTIRYGNVQIGGTGGPLVEGTTIRSTPPSFTIHAQNAYDDAGRTATSQKIRVDVRAVFFSETVALSANQLLLIRRHLMEPRQEIVFTGTGCGLDGNYPDTGWGPKPISCTFQMHGKLTAVVNWSIEIEISACLVSKSLFAERFKSFVFAQSYSLDDEGLLTRITAGYWEIAPQIPGGTQISDQFRERVNVQVPNGFRRVSQNYSESTNKTRTEFQIVDVQLSGDALPPFISDGEGSFSIASDGPGFAQGIASLDAVLTVAPGVPPNYAYLQFFLMVEQKLGELQAAGSVVIPMGIMVSRGLFSKSRTSRFSFQWQLTQCIAAFLGEAFWNPLENSGDWESWSQSISYMWHQRGVAQIGSNPDNDDQINLCSATTQVDLVSPPAFESEDNRSENPLFQCQNIDQRKSWLDYDVEIRFMKTNNKVFHKLAVNPNTTQTTIADPIYGTGGYQPSEQFDPTGKEDIAEEIGIPTQLVLLRAKGLRVQHKPVMPIIKKVGGQDVEPYGSPQFDCKIAFNVGCAVYKFRGYQVYKVRGNVASIDQVNENPTICGDYGSDGSNSGPQSPGED